MARLSVCSAQPRADFKGAQFNRRTDESSCPPPALTPADCGAASRSKGNHGDGGTALTAAGRVGERQREGELGGRILQGMRPEDFSRRPLGEGLLPGRLGTCQGHTCLSSLLSAHVLASAPDSPQMGDSQHLGCKQGRGGPGKPPAGALSRPPGGG